MLRHCLINALDVEKCIHMIKKFKPHLSSYLPLREISEYIFAQSGVNLVLSSRETNQKVVKRLFLRPNQINRRPKTWKMSFCGVPSTEIPFLFQVFSMLPSFLTSKLNFLH